MLPQTHRALVLDQIGQPLRVDNVHPTPQPTSGSVVVKVIAAGVLSYSREIYNGARKYKLPTPCVPGCGAIGRVVAVCPDSTSLQEGDLVLCDIYVRGRDNPNDGALLGVHDGHSPRVRRMMNDAWRDSTYAEYAKLPLENCFRLNERRLLTAQEELGLGYTAEELLYLTVFAVPFGGLSSVGLCVGETVLVSPATGMFGSAAVYLALAMGANVVAMGRNLNALEKLKADVAVDLGRGQQMHTVRITNDVQQDTQAIASAGLPIDVFFDTSPPEAAGSTHFKSGLLSLAHGGRASFMGGVDGDTGIPIRVLIYRNITLKGKWMYERENMMKLIQMVESGRLRLGERGGCRVVGRYGLEQWKAALDDAADQAGPGRIVSIIP